MLFNKASYFNQMHSIFSFEGDASIRDITFQVTEDCNLQCSYCYQHNKTKKVMNFETAKKYIDIIFDNKNNPDAYYNKYNTKGFVINFIGGEPFLEIDLIEKIIEYFEKRFLEDDNDDWLLTHCYNFSSNGTLYFTPKVQNLIKKYSPLIAIGITVDGSKELHDSCRLFPDGHGSYDLAAAAAKAEQERGSESSKITISPNNIDYILDGIKTFIEQGNRFININCVFENVWDTESAIKLYKQLIKISDWITEQDLYDKIYLAILHPSNFKKATEDSLNKGWCGAGKSRMSCVGVDGDIYPCLRFSPSSLGKIPPLSIGNVEKGFLSNNRERKNDEKIQQCNRKSLSDNKCLECPISGGCSWCLGYVYECDQELKKKTNFICEPFKMSALASKYLCKINNDKKAFDDIKLNYEMYKNLITEKEFNEINFWEGGK